MGGGVGGLGFWAGGDGLRVQFRVILGKGLGFRVILGLGFKVGV